jgi:hypothetical protein
MALEFLTKLEHPTLAYGGREKKVNYWIWRLLIQLEEQMDYCRKNFINVLNNNDFEKQLMSRFVKILCTFVWIFLKK